ncbi:hypothetical protein L1887_12922 [Cichorium endivia]|nr:hypothetical protein L1887_12922 [Cichorium endivia]
MEQDDESPPTARFQSPITTTHRRKQPIDPVILIILLPILVLLLLFFLLHPLLSYIPKTIKPTSPKSTWDSLKLSLVFFVILCGVFVPMNLHASSSTAAMNPVNSIVPESYEYREKVHLNGRPRRSSRSYPDLRQEFESLRGSGENWSRGSHDFGVDVQYSSSVNNRSRRGEGGKEGIYPSETISGDIGHRPRRSEADEVYVEGSTELSRNVPDSMVQLRPLSPPAPTTPLSVKSRRRRTSRSLGRDEKSDGTGRIDGVQKVSHNPPPSPPSPPPLVQSENQSQQNLNKLDGKVSETTIELATKIDSVDDQRKRKRKSRHKSRDIQPVIPSIQSPPSPPLPPPYDMLKQERVHKDTHFVPAAAPPVMPPPPPPLRSIFNALFKTNGKRKRFPSKTSPTPSPPSSIITSFFKTGTKRKHVNSSSAGFSSPRFTFPVTLKRESKLKNQIQFPSPPSQPKPEARNLRPVGTYKPPLPTKTSNPNDRDDFLPSSSHSPLIPISHPSPLFNVPAVKFELRGDSISLESTHEPVPGSPDREPVDFTSVTINGEGSFGPSSVSFPSPDVNEKADSFISKCKQEWRKEIINSV